MTLKRINRVAIGKIARTPVWDYVEDYQPAAPQNVVYVDLEVTDASAMEFSRPQIALTGRRGDGQDSPSVSGNKDASPSLAFYLRGLDLAGGAAHGVNASTAAPQYDMLLEQSTGGTIRNIQGEDVIAGSTRWVLQFGAARVAAVGYAIGDVIGWTNAAGAVECLPIVGINLGGADTVTVAGDSGTATGGFSAAPAATDDIYGMRTYPVSQTAGERAHVTVHGQLGQSGLERLFQGCLGSLSIADADGLLVATWAAQAQTWTAQQNAAGAPVFGAFTAPNLGPVSTRGARVLICENESWGVNSAGTFAAADVAVATAISSSVDMGTDIQPRTAATGTNGRQGFVAVETACGADIRLYHDGTTANLLAGGSQTFGDGAALQFMDNQTVSLLLQFGDTAGQIVVVEIPTYQANAAIGEEGGLATIDLTGKGFRPANGSATARIHLL